MFVIKHELFPFNMAGDEFVGGNGMSQPTVLAGSNGHGKEKNVPLGLL